MEKNDFVQCLDNIANANEDIQNQCRSVIIDMRVNNPILFFNLVFQVFEDENSSLSQVIICLSAVRDMFIPTNGFTFAQITENWFSDFMSELRVPLKNFIINFIHNEDVRIRNLSASVFALIFAIEINKLVENYWPQAVSKLVDEFISKDTIESCKHGIMTFFHELMILPPFQTDIKSDENFIQHIGPEIKRFLFQLIQNLEKPDSNSYEIFDYSILCIYDLITYVHEVFDGEKEITFLLNSYESALPMTNSMQYQILFRVLYKVIENFYEHIDRFMETIFNLSSKGIDCPNDELVCISIEFWIQFTMFEKTLKTDTEKFTEKAIDSLIKLLLNVISQNKENTFNQSIELLRILSYNYSEKTVNIVILIIDPLIINDEDMIGVFVSLALINGICSKRNYHFDKLAKYFSIITNIIDIGVSNKDGIDYTIPKAAIWAANRMIVACETIANEQATFDFILKLYQNYPINSNLVIPILQLSIALFEYSNTDLIHKNFSDFFDIHFKLLDDTSIITDDNCLNTNFSALSYLVQKTIDRDPKLQVFYPKVLQKLDEYMSLSEGGSEDFHDIKLCQTLQLINVFIMKISNDFYSFAESLITDTLIQCSKKYKDLTFDTILSILSSLCIHIKQELFIFSEYIAEFINIGFSQDPAIISQSFILCADFIIYVNNSKVELIEQMFDLVDPSPKKVGPTIPSDQIQMIIPSFIKQFARMFLKIKYKLGDPKNGDFTWPEEILNRFYDIVDEQIKSSQLSIDYEKNSNNFNYYNAARIYEGYFYAYAAYYKYQRATLSNYKKAVDIIYKKVIFQCRITKAFDCYTAIALCKLLKKLFNLFKNKINSILLKNNITHILTKYPEYDDIHSKFREKVDFTIKYIKYVNKGKLESFVPE